MKGRMNTGFGEVVINPDVIATLRRKRCGRVFRYRRYGCRQYERWACQAFTKR